MANTDTKTRSIAEILMSSGPNRAEADQIVKLVRAAEKPQALAAIEKAFECTTEEAGPIFDAYVETVVGTPSKLVEIQVSEVEVRGVKHDLETPTQYVARRAAAVGSFFKMAERVFYFDGRSVDVDEIDQVWKLVPASDIG